MSQALPFPLYTPRSGGGSSSSEPERIKKMVFTSTTVTTLPGGSTINIGGVNYDFSGDETVNTASSGAGGIDTGSIAASSFYYVYAVLDGGGQPAITASLSSESPTGFANSRKVGAFYTDGSSNIFKVYWYGEIVRQVYSFQFDGTVSPSTVSSESVDFINGNLTRNSTGNYTGTFVTGIFSVAPNAVVSIGSDTSGQPYSWCSAATTIQIRSLNNAGTSSANFGQFTVTVTKVGIDATQPDWSLIG